MTIPEFLYEAPDGEILLTDHRIGLAHVVRAYRRGASAEMIALEFPSLPLALVHKVLAFYLENLGDVDAYVERGDAQLDRLRSLNAAPSAAELRQRLQKQPAPAQRA